MVLSPPPTPIASEGCSGCLVRRPRPDAAFTWQSWRCVGDESVHGRCLDDGGLWLMSWYGGRVRPVCANSARRRNETPTPLRICAGQRRVVSTVADGVRAFYKYRSKLFVFSPRLYVVWLRRHQTGVVSSPTQPKRRPDQRQANSHPLEPIVWDVVRGCLWIVAQVARTRAVTAAPSATTTTRGRSEERRVGKECA